MNERPQEKRVYQEREPAFYKHLESLLEAGLSELVEEDQRYVVTSIRGENWVRYLRPAPR